MRLPSLTFDRRPPKVEVDSSQRYTIIGRNGGDLERFGAASGLLARNGSKQKRPQSHQPRLRCRLSGASPRPSACQ